MGLEVLDNEGLGDEGAKSLPNSKHSQAVFIGEAELRARLEPCSWQVVSLFCRASGRAGPNKICNTSVYRPNDRLAGRWARAPGCLCLFRLAWGMREKCPAAGPRVYMRAAAVKKKSPKDQDSSDLPRKV